MAKINIAVIVGSNRRESLNRKLARALAKLVPEGLALTIVQIDDLPLYNQDHESDLPTNVVRFKHAVTAADGILFVTPEHSRSIPAVLKNAIDWGARPWGQNSWADKAAAITGTSPGAISTALAQQHLRQILSAQGVLVMGGEAYIAFKPGLIDDAEQIPDEGTRAFLQSFLDRFASLVKRLAAPASQPREAAA
jgi:chromate reductase